MSAPNLHLYREPEPGAMIDAAEDAARQANAAELSLYRDPSTDWFHFPWAGVDRMVDGVGAGEVWFLGGFSGAGKTTVLMNLVQDKLDAGQRIYYVGTETKPNELRTRLACTRVGVYAGDVLSGKAAREYVHWENIREKLVADIRQQKGLGNRNEFFVCPVQRVNAGVLRGAFEDAKAQDVHAIVIDHIDHAEHGAGRNGFEDSKMLAHLVLDLAQETGLPTLVATQFNNEGPKGDILGQHKPPQPHFVYMGGHKRQIAWGMLGIYRPLRDYIGKEDMQRARETRITKPLLQPGVIAVSCMKHRHHGAHEGDIAYLSYERGRLFDLPERDRLDPKRP